MDFTIPLYFQEEVEKRLQRDENNKIVRLPKTNAIEYITDTFIDIALDDVICKELKISLNNIRRKINIDKLKIFLRRNNIPVYKILFNSVDNTYDCFDATDEFLWVHPSKINDIESQLSNSSSSIEENDFDDVILDPLNELFEEQFGYFLTMNKNEPISSLYPFVNKSFIELNKINVYKGKLPEVTLIDNHNLEIYDIKHILYAYTLAFFEHVKRNQELLNNLTFKVNYYPLSFTFGIISSSDVNILLRRVEEILANPNITFFQFSNFSHAFMMRYSLQSNDYSSIIFNNENKYIVGAEDIRDITDVYDNFLDSKTEIEAELLEMFQSCASELKLSDLADLNSLDLDSLLKIMILKLSDFNEITFCNLNTTFQHFILKNILTTDKIVVVMRNFLYGLMGMFDIGPFDGLFEIENNSYDFAFNYDVESDNDVYTFLYDERKILSVKTKNYEIFNDEFGLLFYRGWFLSPWIRKIAINYSSPYLVFANADKRINEYIENASRSYEDGEALFNLLQKININNSPLLK